MYTPSPALGFWVPPGHLPVTGTTGGDGNPKPPVRGSLTSLGSGHEGMLVNFYAVSLANHFRHRGFKLKTQKKERFSFLKLFYYHCGYDVCEGVCEPRCMWGQPRSTLWSWFLLPHLLEFWGSNTCHQTYKASTSTR